MLRIMNIFCWFWILLNVTQLIISVDADEDISVITSNSSSVVLSWKIKDNFVEDLHSLIVKHRPRYRLPNDRKPRLIYDSVSDCYMGLYDNVDESEYAWKTTNITEFHRDAGTSSINEMIITIGNLFSNMEYDFILTRIRSSHLWRLGNRTTSIVAKTRASEPKSAPGCFRIIDIGVEDRLVDFFWVGETDEYVIEIREEGEVPDTWKTVHELRGPLNEGHKTATISHRRHWFILKRLNHPEVGSSAFYVPHQREILDGPADLGVSQDHYNNVHSLTWTKPAAGIDVTHYTLVWISASRASDGDLVITFLDFVLLSGDRTSVRVKANENAVFLLATNTVTTSSGLHLAILEE